MKRIMLTIAYDGTAYRGWQIQPDEPTVEGVLNRELSGLLKEEISVIGASRTDTGVHAMGAVAVFDTGSSIPGDKFSFALNQRLPDDIRIL
nr:tRNA pseudouridine(38-40) synthase TruA [Lachnospiraceae bacterium]